ACGLSFGAEPGLERGPGCEPFDAVPMKAAGAGPLVTGQPDRPDVPKLAMGEAACRLAVHDQADADTRPDSDVGKFVEAAPAAPPHLRQRRAVHVSIDRDGHSGGTLEPLEHVRARPARLGRARDPAVSC